MQCYVYKSTKKNDHFLYLSSAIGVDGTLNLIPSALLEMLGELSFVIDFELTTERELPNADVAQVLADLTDRGYYLQMPVESMHSLEDRLFS